MRKKIEVLYIEDNSSDHVVMRAFFDKHDSFVLTLATTLHDGLTAFASGNFDVVLTDYNLGQESCLPVIEAAKNKVPVILITGAGNETVAVRSMKLGASDYLTKDNHTRFYDDVLLSIENSIKLFSTEKKLRETQQQFQELFENTSDLIQSVFSDGRIEFVNPSWRRAMEFTEEDLSTITIFDFVHPDFHDQCRALPEHFKSGVGTERVEMKFVSKTGNILFVEGNMHSVVENGVAKIRGVIRNITERKLAEAKLNEINQKLTSANDNLESLTRNLHNLVEQKNGELQSYQEAIDMNIFSAVLDESGKIKKANRPMMEVSGYTEKELIGQHFLIIGAECPSEMYEGAVQTLANRQLWRGEVITKAKNGQLAWIDLTIIPIFRNNQPTDNFLALGLPITERKEAEARQNQMLRMLETIAFRTSHKVRGPMARIQGLANLLENDLVKETEFKMLAAKMKESTGELDHATRALIEFVNKHYETLNIDSFELPSTINE